MAKQTLHRLDLRLGKLCLSMPQAGEGHVEARCGLETTHSFNMIRRQTTESRIQRPWSSGPEKLSWRIWRTELDT